MAIRLILSVLAALTAAPAIAASLADDLRAALAAGDLARLDPLIAAAQAEAMAQRDHSALRHAYRRVFASTDPMRLDQIKAWVAIAPDSAPAWTALAEVQLWRAWAIKPAGESPTRPGEPARAALLAAAQKAAFHAADLDPTFARSVQIAQNLPRDGLNNRTSLSLYEAFAEQTADHQTLIAAAEPLLRSSDLAPFFEFCAKHAPAVANVTFDLCAAEAVLSASASYLAQPAAEVIATEGENALALPRLEGMITRADQLGRLDDPDTALALHAQLRSEIGNVAYWTTVGQRLVNLSGDQLYQGEVLTGAVEEIAIRLEDDPANPWLYLALRRLAPDVMSVSIDSPLFERAAMQALWLAVLPYGQIDPQFWLESQYVFSRGYFDTENILPMLENAAILSGNDVYYVGKLYEYLAMIEGRGDFTMQALSEAVADTPGAVPQPPTSVTHCPLLRAARLYQALCKSDPYGTYVCGPASIEYRTVPDTLKDTELLAACPAEAKALPRSLLYTELRAVGGYVPGAIPIPQP